MGRQEINHPKLRFPEFCEKWKETKLGDIADIVGGGTPSTSASEYWDGDIDWYTPAEISCQRYVSSSQRKITTNGLNHSSAKMMPTGTVLFTSRAGIGKTAILQKEGCTNQGFQSIIPHEKKLDSYFIFSRTNELKRYGERIGAGSTFVEVSGKQMADMSLLMPLCYDEQVKIGSFFKAYDDKISLQQQKVEAMERRKKGLLQKVFSQEIRFKADDGSEFPEWEEKKLSEEADFLQGLTYKPENVKDSGTLVLRSSNVQNGRIVYTDNVYVQMQIPERICTKTGDVLMCVRNGSKKLVGKCALINVPDSGNAWGAFMTVIRSHTCNKYIYYFLSSELFSNQMFQDLGTATIAQITFGMLNRCKVVIPCLTEQQKIADFFSAIDKQIEIEKKRLESMQTIKKGLLQQMFC